MSSFTHPTPACPQPQPSAWVQRFGALIAPHTRVLDVACGQGRHMRWLASQGHTVTGVDRDPAALAQAAAWGHTVQADIENGPWPFKDQHFGAIIVTHYLWRPLLPHILACVAPAGVLLYETFAQGNETVGKPSRADFLLAPGELLRTCAQPGWRIVAYEDGFLSGPDRFVQRIAAVRQGPQPTGTPPRYPL
ncbi:MAG: class I SAM-dependent methyltransferase [Pseudomonadota bacterium]|nr:class I SAM-dependent methyltransferase [Pseudomonadota bacterium]